MRIDTINFLFALGTIILQIGILKLLIFIMFKKQLRKFFWYGLLERYAFLFAFLLALAATVGSLFYSHVVGFPPCDLCWYQRIFMYPQVIILGIAVWKKEYSAKLSVITLSIIGALVSLYQVLLQFGAAGNLGKLLDCTTDLTQPSCATIDFIEFGYITMPVMALTVFVLIALTTSFQREKTN